MNRVLRAGVSGFVVAILAIGAITLLVPGSLSGPIGTGGNTSYQGSGTLAVLVTDPPIVPDGVTAIQVNYSNFEVHVSSAGNSSGWHIVSTSGSLELMGLVNFTQTIASAKLPAGDYNAVRFNVSSASVTYNGAQYTAFVPSGSLFVNMESVAVRGNSTSAILVDLTPTVINIGTGSAPEFIISPVAHVYSVPPEQVPAAAFKVGFRGDMKAMFSPYFVSFLARGIQITGASLAPSSLSVTVKNDLSGSARLFFVVVTPVAVPYMGSGSSAGGTAGSGMGGGMGSGAAKGMPVRFGMVIRFLIEPSGALVPLPQFPACEPPMMGANSRGNGVASSNKSGIMCPLAGEAHGNPNYIPIPIGYSLASGASYTFAYSGQMSFGFDSSGAAVPSFAIVPGQQYRITVIGFGVVASTVVTAGSGTA